MCASEMLPIDEGHQRAMRAGMLADTLRARQHEVTWWTSAFNHSTKRLRCDHTSTVTLGNGTRLKLLFGRAYRRNVCLARLLNHYQLALEFARQSAKEITPDLILCCWPTIELAAACVRYAEKHNIPVVLDVRDLWPDILLDVIPRSVRWVAKWVSLPYSRMTRKAFERCTAIVGISENYLNWGLGYAGRPRKEFDAVFPLGYQEPVLPPAVVEAERSYLQALGVDDSRTICWFLGSFGQTYDLEPIIHAARELQQLGESRFQFVFSGDGEKRRAWQELARGLRNVVFTGWLDAARIAAMMRMSRIGLAAYRKGAPQGLPNKIFEYLAGGLPILSCLTGECEQFLRSAGCGSQYVAGDSRSFLEELLKLTSSEKYRSRIAMKCLHAFRTQYSASRVYPALACHLERLAGCASSTPA